MFPSNDFINPSLQIHTNPSHEFGRHLECSGHCLWLVHDSSTFAFTIVFGVDVVVVVSMSSGLEGNRWNNTFARLILLGVDLIVVVSISSGLEGNCWSVVGRPLVVAVDVGNVIVVVKTVVGAGIGVVNVVVVV